MRKNNTQDNILKQSHNIHIIGIGGIGVSSIARMLLLEGKNVSGSDRSDSIIVEELGKSGANVCIGHAAEHIPEKTDLVIYTIAIPKDNPEFLAAQQRGITMLTYPESLHEISKNKYTIAVSGTHGKTTTTAMIARIMIDAGLDPTVIVGSLLKDHGSNFISGNSEYFLVEACEYMKSFLNLEPNIAVVTNIDNDHLDYYKDIAAIKGAFGEFVAKLPQDGWLVINKGNEVVASAVKQTQATIIDSREMKTPEGLKFPGAHNKENARMAIAVAHILGISQTEAARSLTHFNGTWRRFELKGKAKNGALIYDDYAHHPTEIKAALAGARELYPDKRIVLAFQPHLYSRTKLLLEDFKKSFIDADLLLLAPIYAAREPEDPSISSHVLRDVIGHTDAHAFDTFQDIEQYLTENLLPNDVLITMGAGDIYKIGEIFSKSVLS